MTFEEFLLAELKRRYMELVDEDCKSWIDGDQTGEPRGINP